MDPNMAYGRWARALARGDMSEAIAAAMDLSAWLIGGGHKPRVFEGREGWRATRNFTDWLTGEMLDAIEETS